MSSNYCKGGRMVVCFILFSLTISGCAGPSDQINHDNMKNYSSERNHLTSELIDGFKVTQDFKMADLDMDGNVDLAVLSKYNGLLLIFDLGGKKKIVKQDEGCFRPVSMAAGDFDSDGRQEIVVLSEGGLCSYLRINSADDIEIKKISSPSAGWMWKLEPVDFKPGCPPGLVGGGNGLLIFFNRGRMEFDNQKIFNHKGTDKKDDDLLKKVDSEKLAPVLASLGASRSRNHAGSAWVKHCFKYLKSVNDLNRDGISEILALDYCSRDAWLLESEKNKRYSVKHIFHFNNISPIFGEFISGQNVPEWVVACDYPGTVLLLEGVDALKKRSAFTLPGRAASALKTDLNADSVPDIIVFVENKILGRPGDIYIFYGVSNNGEYSLLKGPVINTEINSACGLAYKTPFLGMADYQSGKIQILRKGRDF